MRGTLFVLVATVGAVLGYPVTLAMPENASPERKRILNALGAELIFTDAQQGMILNIIVGIVGALIGGWLLSPMVGAGTVNQGDFSLMGLLVSLGGAIILLLVVNLVRRGAAEARAA